MNVKVNSLFTLYHPVSLYTRLSRPWGPLPCGSSSFRRLVTLSYPGSGVPKRPSEKKIAKNKLFPCAKTVILLEWGGNGSGKTLTIVVLFLKFHNLSRHQQKLQLPHPPPLSSTNGT